MSKLRNAIGVSLFLYALAICTSMAAMELFSWLTFTLVGVYAIQTRKNFDLQWKDLDEVLPWKTMIALSVIVVLGVFINAPPGSDLLMPIGKMRSFFLIASTTVALFLFPVSLKSTRIFAYITTLIAVYAIFQSFTGVDFIRPDGRAVQSFTTSTGSVYWKAAGTFGSPMSYVYIAGQYLFLFASFAVFSKDKQFKSIMIAATVLVGLSVLATYIRGAWIAAFVSVLVMSWIVSRKFFAATAAGIIAFSAAAITFSASVQTRFLSLFDPNMSSNIDRLRLWKANLAMFYDFPLLGTGYTFNEDLAEPYLAKIGFPGAFAGHAHNNFLQMLAGTGILGFTAYLVLIAFFLRLSYRLFKFGIEKNDVNAKIMGLGTLGAQIFIHVGGLTECNFKDGETHHAICFVWALAASSFLLLKRNRTNLQTV